MTSDFASRVSRLTREEGDILHDHGLHGGGFLLLNFPREARESDEAEHGDDCEISLMRYLRAMSRLTISQSRDLLVTHLPMAAVAMPDIAHVRQLRKMPLDGSRCARKQLGKALDRDLRIRPDIIDQLQIK